LFVIQELLATEQQQAAAAEWAAVTQAVLELQFGNLLAVTVCVQDLTVT